MKRKEIKWRREGRRVMTGRQDGQPVGIAGGEIPEISLAEEKPGIYLEGETIDAIRKKAEEMYISEAVFNRELAEAITRAWNNLTDTMAAAAEVFTAWIKTVAEEIQARNELKTAVRWASVYNRPLAYRYRHTKKKRTRKKYAKLILAWYREEVL